MNAWVINKVRVGVVGGLLGSLLIGPEAVRAEQGALTQFPGLEGCISNDGSGPCTDGRVLDSPIAVTVAPGGKHVYVGLPNDAGLAVLARDKATGALTQLPGSDGCITETGSNGQCADGTGLRTIRETAISPDGRYAYVASWFSDAVAVFARNRTTGVLTQLPGLDGCVSQDFSGNSQCTYGRELDGAASLAVSPDGKHLYVASNDSHAVVAFSRNTTTGVLTQLPGQQGCISDTGSDGACTDGRALRYPGSLKISNDGKHVYVTVHHGVAIFARDKSTGALTQLPGTAGCIRQAVVNTDGQCTDGRGLGYASSVAVSEDGRHLYVASIDDAVAVFARNRTTGTLTQLPGLAGCISQSGENGQCDYGKALDDAISVAISPDGKQVYVASVGSDAVAVFARNRATGVLRQLPGQQGCIGQYGNDGLCTEGKGLDYAIRVAVSPDGKHVYAAGWHSKAVAVLQRER